MSKIESGAGGTFEIDENGQRVLVTPPSARHEDGDRPREADGTAIVDVAVATEPALPAAANDAVDQSVDQPQH